MPHQNIRVMLAAEYPGIRSLLKEAVEAANSAVIVGQAENATRAVALAKTLRPDVAIIDSYLPHSTGLDTVALSRIGGLDTAQTISDEIPNIRVVLLNSLENESVPGQGDTYFCRESREACIPFTLDELRMDKMMPAGALVFARIVTESKPAPRENVIGKLSNKAVMFGSLGILGGGILIITLLFSGAGIYLAFAGVATLLAGLAGIVVSKLLKRI